jgi:exodeoxyribonuclease VII small subunit
MSVDLALSLTAWRQASESGTFEESMAALESIVALLDTGELNLDQSLDCFEIGARLNGRCQLLLEQAELRIELVQRSLDVEAAPEPPF